MADDNPQAPLPFSTSMMPSWYLRKKKKSEEEIKKSFEKVIGNPIKDIHTEFFKKLKNKKNVI